VRTLQDRAIRFIRQGISSGRLIEKDGRLKSSRQIARLASISAPTIHLALRELGEQGVVVSRWGKGYYLREASAVQPPCRCIVVVSAKPGNLNETGDFIGHAMHAGMAAACEQHQVSMVFQHPVPLKARPEWLRETAEGVLLLEDDDEVALLARRLGVPCARITHFGHPTASLPADVVVGTDRNRAAYLATRHLIEAGARRIGLVMASQTVYVRLPGHRLALREAGLPEGPIREIAAGCCDDQIEKTRRTISRYLDEHGLDVDAFFFSTDYMASGAIRALRDRDIEPGRDVGVCGFDGNELAFLHVGPFCTVCIHRDREIITAVDLLLQKLDGKTLPREVKLEPEIVCHHTCGRGSPG